VRKEVIQREGRVADEKVEVDCTRVNMGGDGREGEGGRDGDRTRGEVEVVRRRGTLTDRSPDGGGTNGLSEVASLRASSNGSTSVVVSITVLGASTTALNIPTAESAVGCG
jgi:hypothetical protein